MGDHSGGRIVIAVTTIQLLTLSYRGWVHNPNWYDVTLASITRDIPFVTTDYRELGIQINVKFILKANWMEAMHTLWRHQVST